MHIKWCSNWHRVLEKVTSSERLNFTLMFLKTILQFCFLYENIPNSKHTNLEEGYVRQDGRNVAASSLQQGVLRFK